MRIDDHIEVSNATQDRRYSAQQFITLMDAGPSGGGGSSRATMTATYQALTANPTVYYTALDVDGGTITARTTSGVVFVAGLYTYVETTIDVTDFIAVWDEGDPSVYAAEWIVVDT